MTADVDAFHATVYADPADPLPRLAYADWLDDHGEAEYAELIRVWHRVHQRRDPRRRKEVRDRRHQLVRLLDDRWRWDGGLRFLDVFDCGVLPDRLGVTADQLTPGWRRWPAFLRPRALIVSGYSGLEAAVLRATPVVRGQELSFYGVGEPMWQPPYPPDSDPLLAELAQTDHLTELRSLLLRSVRPSRTALARFAGSPLARHLRNSRSASH